MADDSGFFTSEISASDLTVLIVDPASSFGQVLVGGFIEMGCDKEKICNCKKYSDALELLNSRRPMVLLTEYMIDGKPGMELAAHHATLHQNKVSILITHNTSASAVAEAAEELVDDYLIKPFSMGNLIDRLKILIRKKLNPSPYVSAIRKGKELVKEGNYVAALEEFKKAEGLEKKPTLAYYYLGNTYFLQGNYELAVVHFKKGLNLQPLHYKCLLGEFDAYFEQKNYKAAYEIAPRILQNYPLSPKRLGNLFIAAVFTRHFQDIPKYHSLYEQLDHKSGEIKKVFSAAIFTAGKFHLKDNNIQSAAECFDIGVNVMGADVEYLTKIIRELLKMQGAGAQWAAVYLTRFPRDEVGGATHSRLSFLVDRYLRNKVQVIEAGKKMIAQGFGDEETFPVMVTLLAETGKLILAEDMATKAIAQFPALRKSLYELIETSKSKLHQH